MSGIYGIWKNEMSFGDSSVVTTHTIREDGSYETHMIYGMGGGCRQHIFHFGKLDFDDASLRLSIESGETEMRDCEDPPRNFDRRGFTETEINEATSLLGQEIPYIVDDDRLTMTVKGPMGEMEVVYNRHVD